MADPKDGAPVEIKKVAPYPIAIDLFKEDAPTPFKGQIVKMTEIGFLMKVEQNVFKVGGTYDILFELPVVKSEIHGQARVIKTYDSLDGNKASMTKMYTVEMHFKGLDDEQKRAIGSYLVKSGQKKY